MQAPDPCSFEFVFANCTPCGQRPAWMALCTQCVEEGSTSSALSQPSRLSSLALQSRACAPKADAPNGIPRRQNVRAPTLVRRFLPQTKMIESTVPRPNAEALEGKRRALRRVRTDPADTEAHIRSALLSEGLDLKALAAQVGFVFPYQPSACHTVGRPHVKAPVTRVRGRSCLLPGGLTSTQGLVRIWRGRSPTKFYLRFRLSTLRL